MNQIHILNWFLLSGITESIGETPLNRFQNAAGRARARLERLFAAQRTDTTALSDTNAVSTQPAAMKGVEKTGTRPTPAAMIIRPSESAASTDSSFLAQATALADSAANLADLTAALNQFEGCSLKKTAAHTLDGMGVQEKPTVLCLIDAPKSADEKAGCLGSGDSGLLLTKMLKAIQLDCAVNTYLAPLIPWRLPGDRKPTENETTLCLPFLRKRIELLQPQFILMFGALPTQALLQIESISKARQQAVRYKTAAGQTIPVVVTFGPDMVAKGQSYRTNAWADLQKLQKMINEQKEEKNA